MIYDIWYIINLICRDPSTPPNFPQDRMLLLHMVWGKQHFIWANQELSCHINPTQVFHVSTQYSIPELHAEKMHKDHPNFYLKILKTTVSHKFLYDFAFFPSIDPLWFPSTAWGSSGKLPLCTCFYMGPKIMRISPISISVEQQLRKVWCCTSASERSSTTTTTWRVPRCVWSRRRRVREGSRRRRRLRCELDDPAADFYCNGALLWFVYWIDRVYCWGKNIISMMINDCLWVFLDVFWLMHLRWWKEKGWSLDTPRNKPTRGLISSRVDAARKWAADQENEQLTKALGPYF